MMRLVGPAVLLVAACSFSPKPANNGGDDDDQPAGDDAAPPIDAADEPDGNMATADARQCFGTGLVQVCLSAAPTGTRTLPGTTATPLDTDANANCTQVFPQTGGDEICVIAADEIVVDGAFTATGTRPLVLIGATRIGVTATGTIDVSSTATRKGAGANHAAVCTAEAFVARAGEGDRGGGGGGAGGGFGTVGSNGGTGDSNDNHPPTPHLGVAGVAGGQQPVPTLLRGGCPGGAAGGGTSTITVLGPAGGNGGGGVYLIAGTQIAITGNVFASGAGGRADAGSGGFEEGGSGGGSGGMIGLDAPAITLDGILAANGGAGAGGGGTVGGTVGADGTTIAFNTRAAKGTGDTAAGGGDGADGTSVGATTTTTPATVISGGGGGGGGVGVVWIDGTVTGGTQVSPAPTAH